MYNKYKLIIPDLLSSKQSESGTDLLSECFTCPTEGMVDVLNLGLISGSCPERNILNGLLTCSN